MVLSRISVPVYIYVLAPIVLNIILLYYLGVGIQKLLPIKYKVAGIIVAGFIFGSIILSFVVSLGFKGVPIFESLAPLGAPGMFVSEQLITTKEGSNTRLIINPGNDAAKSIQDLIQQRQGKPTPLAWIVITIINGIVYSFLFWLFYLLAGRMVSNAYIGAEGV
ncbi:MAG: hypothetical protein G01um101430_131 [Parcubacteria group bacterium Gr01-1014_30]|nr:MAG: hypothetical protein G01um101430_131 [Parcubacteria group bacterium Gr01-1014_30]